MKRMISICLFTVIIAICIGVSVKIFDGQVSHSIDNSADAKTTQTVTEGEGGQLRESMKIQETYCYLLVEENGSLIVYEQDGKTVFLEIDISLHGLDDTTREMLQKGIWIRDEEELYDFLESYSS